MKQVIVVNESLRLPRGKLAAQVAHASVAGFLASSSTVQQAWLDAGMPKVVLSASSEQEVIALYQKAVSADLPAQIIKDAGKTVLESGTLTCASIGPASIIEIDGVTKHLKLV